MKFRFSIIVAIVLAAVLLGAAGSTIFSKKRLVIKGRQTAVRVTGYCNCGKCCSWKRSWFGLGPPVFTTGPLKGKRKKVGVTARGTTAKKGTIAADTSIFPFGTKLYVPGYGFGVVEDTGGAVKGKHIDLWFPSHAAALKWGSKNLQVVVSPTVVR